MTRVRGCHSERAIPWFLVGALAWSQAGCKERDIPAAAITVTVASEAGDPVTGDLLLVAVHQETPEFARPPIAGPTTVRYRTTQVELTIVQSPFRLTQKAVDRREVPTKEGIRTRFYLVDYHVLADGFQVGGIDCQSVASFAEVGRPATVSLQKVSPGDRLSDVSVLSDVRYLLREAVPYVKADDPLRAKLLELLRKRAEAVASAGVRDHKEEAANLLRVLRAAGR